MDEVWRPVKGYEGFYEVSNTGRVRSVERTREQLSSHGTIMAKKYPGREIRPTDNGNGYKIVRLGNCAGMKRGNYYVHRLVAEAFLENPEGLPVVNHLDYDKGNNNACNLEWTTQAGNVNHSVANMRKDRKKYKKSVTGEKYIFIRNGKFRLAIRDSRRKIDRTFATIGDAVRMREVIIGG